MGYGFYETRINKRDNEIKNFGVQYLWKIVRNWLDQIKEIRHVGRQKTDILWKKNQNQVKL